MHKTWRWIAPIAVAGGLLVSGAIPAADASPAASIITISATSPNYPGLTAKDHDLVDGHAVVVYKLANADTATVSGTVTTAATNDTAQLLAEPFGKKSYSAVGTPQPLTTVSSTTASYSFSVTPTLATKYEVQLAGTDTELSSSVTVYVTAYESAPPKWVKNKCTTKRCVFSFRIYVAVPASAYKTESGKHIYLYIAIGDPRLPKDYTLTKAGKVAGPTRVNSGEFRDTLTYYVPVKNAKTDWVPNACAKDTESKDGLGLPGHHGCGSKHVARTTIYLG
jgi:hypothetical protein